MDYFLFIVIFFLIPAVSGVIGGILGVLLLEHWANRKARSWDRSRPALTIAFILLPFAFSSCVTMDGLASVIEKAGQSNATVCAEIVGGGGAMTIAPGAAMPVIPGGGYYGRARFCRSNEPGSEIKASDLGFEIKHGAAITDAIKERIDTLESAVKYLLQKLLESKDRSKSSTAPR